jgi:hypothetical protein
MLLPATLPCIATLLLRRLGVYCSRAKQSRWWGLQRVCCACCCGRVYWWLGVLWMLAGLGARAHSREIFDWRRPFGVPPPARAQDGWPPACTSSSLRETSSSALAATCSTSQPAGQHERSRVTRGRRVRRAMWFQLSEALGSGRVLRGHHQRACQVCGSRGDARCIVCTHSTPCRSVSEQLEGGTSARTAARMRTLQLQLLPTACNTPGLRAHS